MLYPVLDCRDSARNKQQAIMHMHAEALKMSADGCKFPPRSAAVVWLLLLEAVFLASSPRAQARACDWHWRLPGPGHTARFFSFKVLGMFLVLEAKNFSPVAFTFSSVVTDSRE